MTAFVKTVLAEAEDTWQGIYQSQGRSYEGPTLVLFRGQTRSAGGATSAASGPFYCSDGHKVYIDAGFFDELSNRFGASDDFAEAYVVSREVGHHVQNQLGIVPKFNEARQRMCGANAKKMSIRVELQADCFAGIWGKYTQQNVILDAGVVPDILDHGTSAQRVKWFKQGFDSGQLSSCSTFSGHV